MKQDITGDVLPVGGEAELELSIVCPFYNEERIIAQALHSLGQHLEQTLKVRWELIAVDDGSRDRSGEIAAEVARQSKSLRVIGYAHHRGRGHALRTGIDQARGEVVITTEIDLSWGKDIVERLYQAILDHPDVDMVIASPNRPGGGYRNVPLLRVIISRLGNWIIRACIGNAATMNTGMTRAYRRSAIRLLPLTEDGKEFHLEVIAKALALRYRFHEIPATLEWKEYKHEGKSITRKSASDISRLMSSHTLFSLFANPIRYVWTLSAASMLLSLGFLVGGIVRLASDLVSIYMLIVSLSLAIIAIVLFAFGVIAQQGNMIRKELLQLRQELEVVRDRRDFETDAVMEAGRTPPTAARADLHGQRLRAAGRD